MALPPKLRALARTGTKFLLVGGLSTVIEIAVFNLCLLVLGLDIVSAKIIASLVALINAYFGNREWTFRHRERRDRRVEIAWFLAVNVFCLVLGAALVWVGVEFAQTTLQRQLGAWGVNLVNLVSIAIVVVVRFILYHYLVFRRPRATHNV